MEKLALDACGKLFSMRQAADILGIRYQTIRRWTTEGRIDSVKLGGNNRVVLEAALDVGSAAAHRGHAADAIQINAVMDILENLLQAVYVLPDMGEELKKWTPPRPSRKTKGRQ